MDPSIQCQICGIISKRNLPHYKHYEAVCCLGCKAFFRRYVRGINQTAFKCKGGGKCDLSVGRKACKECRFRKCLEVGMEDSKVLNKNDRKKYTHLKKKTKSENTTQSGPDHLNCPNCENCLHCESYPNCLNCPRVQIGQNSPVQESTIGIQLVKPKINSPGVQLVTDLEEPAKVHSLHKPAECANVTLGIKCNYCCDILDNRYSSMDPSTQCQICGIISKRSLPHYKHYEAVCCLGCKAFFRRYVRGINQTAFKCKGGGKCDLSVGRKACKECRFRKCLEVGMDDSKVLNEDDRKKYTHLKKKIQLQWLDTDIWRQCLLWKKQSRLHFWNLPRIIKIFFVYVVHGIAYQIENFAIHAPRRMFFSHPIFYRMWDMQKRISLNVSWCLTSWCAFFATKKREFTSTSWRPNSLETKPHSNGKRNHISFPSFPFVTRMHKKPKFHYLYRKAVKVVNHLEQWRSLVGQHQKFNSVLKATWSSPQINDQWFE